MNFQGQPIRRSRRLAGLSPSTYFDEEEYENIPIVSYPYKKEFSTIDFIIFLFMFFVSIFSLLN